MPARIEICGGIASGKTTLARLLASKPRTVLIEENFRANPFWALSYERPDLFTAEKNICFIPQHTGAIKAAGSERSVVCDYAVVQDLAYARMQKRDHARVMKAVYDHLYLKLSRPRLIVYLKCDARTELQRIRARARPEERTISLSFLEELNGYIEEVLSDEAPAPVHRIDSAKIDFANS
ncbi:MAG: deoxynucleoside kinase, partial [Acidobacteriales bacterium]|nr:deoxynucleoside kinase [Terriglobales bacterium]